MARYPDKFVIMKPIGDVNNPYKAPEYEPVYSGACRCFLRKPTALRVGSVKDSDFRIVVPNRKMPEIGENYRACVKMHTSENSRYWDHVGYVTDFARYDRVCNIDFQMVKENVIYEDLPSPTIDIAKRSLKTIVDDNGFRLEGITVLNGNLVVSSDEILSCVATEKSSGENVYVFQKYESDEGKWRIIRDFGVEYGSRNDDWFKGFFGQIPLYVESEDERGSIIEHNTYYLCQYLSEPEFKFDDNGEFTETQPDYYMKFEIVKEE